MLRLILLIVSLAVASARGATSGVVSDVNNMLRDAKASSSAPVAAATLPPSSVELLRFVDDEDNEEELELLSNGVQLGGNKGQDEQQDVPHNQKLGDQVRLLTKQLNALMMRRREDYELLEHNLRKSLRLTTDAASVDADMRSELDQLRREMETLRATHSGNKERLTVEWLQQSISEIRKQLVELQRTAANVAKDVRHEGTAYEDLATIRNDYQQLKLELAAQRERQQQTEVIVQELREELLQQEQEYKHELNRQLNAKAIAKANSNAIVKQQTVEQSASIEENSSSQEASQESRSMSSSELADHRRRHCRFQQQQIHSLQLAQRSLRRQVNELKYHHIDERVRSIELEQHRIANANFNLSRQIATLDKLHTSMLELLEDVEGLQSKMDKSIPELRHEISKLEFANAQISSEQNLVREENKNAARSLQAMAVSVSVLQDEREGVKKLVSNVDQLQTNVDRIQSLVNDELHNKLSHLNKPHKRPHHQKPQQPQGLTDLRTDNELAETLVAELENVEAQYEAIVNKLPQDCSELSTQVDGLHLIAPAGQHHPLMTHCNADGWTTVQRRFDGSADFNRSWADYAQGFGTPGGEYWIGNEQLHHLTLNNCTQLRVHMQDIYDNNWVAEYKHFYISSRSDGYRLHIGEYSGNASDALNYQQGMQFSAIDDDRDISQTHCAANYEGGWWFSHCQHANLNGRYNLGLTWFDAGRNEWIAVRSSQMLVKRRPSDECAPSNGNEAPTVAAAATTTKSASAGTTPTTTTTKTVVPSTRPNTVVQFVAAAQA
ncbi:protein scabrous isoform X1 [Drosophila novamexicana]|uniref:protein scabrous isoform X1 n=2 Tax=Drosophila novamexicana TaxID=47314 RepID=UPI0011E5B6F7|nr:protein scabrous isoform X1 [Drosophila novamexicana]